MSKKKEFGNMHKVFNPVWIVDKVIQILSTYYKTVKPL